MERVWKQDFFIPAELRTKLSHKYKKNPHVTVFVKRLRRHGLTDFYEILFIFGLRTGIFSYP